MSRHPHRRAEEAQPSDKFRVLAADDHGIVRHGLRILVESQPGVEVCGEASNGREVVEFVKNSKPDLVILDLVMPDTDGLKVIRAIREISPKTEVLVLTIHFSEELAREVINAGALGYVLKSDAESELLAALDHMRRHQPFFTSKLAAAMSRDFIHRPSAGAGTAGQIVPAVSPLTPREIEVVQLLATGKHNKEIAATLEVSARTVESHRNHIMRKMNFSSFSDLVRFAVRNKIIED
jgi:DNA-binding NarL/FixJ family response regulator